MVLKLRPEGTFRLRTTGWDRAFDSGLRFAFSLPQRVGKGVIMDFAIILIVSNTLLAAFIYFVVTRIWQD
jgi:hypothetical protein